MVGLTGIRNYKGFKWNWIKCWFMPLTTAEVFWFHIHVFLSHALLNPFWTFSWIFPFRYASNSDYLTTDDLLLFLEAEQGVCVLTVYSKGLEFVGKNGRLQWWNRHSQGNYFSYKFWSNTKTEHISHQGHRSKVSQNGISLENGNFL